MNDLEKQLQQRVDLLESHYREWKEVLLVEAETKCFLKNQQRQKIIQFTRLNLLTPVNAEWIALMKQQGGERDNLFESNRVKRQFIHNRHQVEKLELEKATPR